MSQYVQFEPDGLFSYEWSPKQRKDVRRGRVKKARVLAKLRTMCQVAEGTTLLNIFDAVDSYKVLKAVIREFSWCWKLEEFHAQAREPMRPGPEDDCPLDFLEIHWDASTSKYKGKIDFTCSPDFCGVGPVRPGKENDPACWPNYDGKKLIAYSVSCSPMWRLADLPVRLNTECIIYEPLPYKGKEPVKLLEAERCFSLLDVLDAIYDDISFYGGPAENKEFLEEMGRRVEEVMGRDDQPTESNWQELFPEDEMS